MPADTVRVHGRDVPLAEIEAEIAAATPGPWGKTPGCYGRTHIIREDTGLEFPPEIAVVWKNRPWDATLIAHAPEYLIALVAEVRALRAQVARDHYRVSLDDGDRGPHVCWICFEGVDEGQEPTPASLWPCAVRRTLLGETPL